MRRRFNVVLVVLFVILCIFIFHSLNIVSRDNKDEQDSDNGYIHKLKETVYLTPNKHDVSGSEVNGFQRVVYNRVPKCGSRSIVTLFKAMSIKNKFRVIEPAMNYPYAFKLQEEKRTSGLLSALQTPFLYHRHMYYLDFKKLDGPSVTYINLIRDPVSRAVSHFYFRRHGDNLLNKSRLAKTIKDQEITYDECVLKKHYECVGNWGIFFIIPFFCGHHKECRWPSRWALDMAKKNAGKYLVVGILEEYDDFIKVLEKVLPNFFRGAYEQLQIPDPSIPPRSVLSSTRKKQKPSENVIAISKENMKLEYEFYDFIKERFHKLKRSLNI